MRRRSICLARCSAITLAASIAACASAPPPRFHTLMPAEPPARIAAARAVAVSAVLEPIRLPAQVDQPQWLVRLPDGAVAVLEQERWASPLRDELRQALLEALIAGWGMTEQRPSAGDGASVRIGIDVRRFDSVIGVEARIAGLWTLVPGDVRAAQPKCDWFIREQATGDASALAAAHRRAVARLAAGIGANLGRVARGENAICPAPDTGA